MAKLTFESFSSFNLKYKLINPNESFVLGVSGGVDSMVLAHLFLASGLNINICHVNHNLRGKDSEEDSHFVRSFCKESNVPYHELTLEPGFFHGKNIQQAARNERYAFFRAVKEKFNFDKICTAHHKDDAIESFFIHLFRGSGLKGLSSIPMQNGDIIRPLLGFTKNEIVEYAKTCQIKFREDFSNEEDKYLRNKIRHHLIPVIKEIQDAAFQKVADSIERINDSQLLIEYLKQSFEEKWKGTGSEILNIPVSDLTAIPGFNTLLFNILQPFGFTNFHIHDIMAAKKDNAVTHSVTHTLIKHQGTITLSKSIVSTDEIHLNIYELPFTLPVKNGIYYFEVKSHESGKEKVNNIYLDLNKLSLPLIFRNRSPGDRFTPLGMNGQSKKVKDFLNDRKIAYLNKGQVFILEDKGIIAAVLPFRISEKFKVTENTLTALSIRFEPYPI